MWTFPISPPVIRRWRRTHFLVATWTLKTVNPWKTFRNDLMAIASEMHKVSRESCLTPCFPFEMKFALKLIYLLMSLSFILSFFEFILKLTYLLMCLSFILSFFEFILAGVEHRALVEMAPNPRCPRKTPRQDRQCNTFEDGQHQLANHIHVHTHCTWANSFQYFPFSHVKAFCNRC